MTAVTLQRRWPLRWLWLSWMVSAYGYAPGSSAGCCSHRWTTTSAIACGTASQSSLFCDTTAAPPLSLSAAWRKSYHVQQQRRQKQRRHYGRWKRRCAGVALAAILATRGWDRGLLYRPSLAQAGTVPPTTTLVSSSRSDSVTKDTGNAVVVALGGSTNSQQMDDADENDNDPGFVQRLVEASPSVPSAIVSELDAALCPSTATYDMVEEDEAHSVIHSFQYERELWQRKQLVDQLKRQVQQFQDEWQQHQRHLQQESVEDQDAFSYPQQQFSWSRITTGASSSPNVRYQAEGALFLALASATIQQLVVLLGMKQSLDQAKDGGGDQEDLTKYNNTLTQRRSNLVRSSRLKDQGTLATGGDQPTTSSATSTSSQGQRHEQQKRTVQHFLDQIQAGERANGKHVSHVEETSSQSRSHTMVPLSAHSNGHTVPINNGAHNNNNETIASLVLPAASIKTNGVHQKAIQLDEEASLLFTSKHEAARKAEKFPTEDNTLVFTSKQEAARRAQEDHNSAFQGEPVTTIVNSTVATGNHTTIARWGPPAVAMPVGTTNGDGRTPAERFLPPRNIVTSTLPRANVKTVADVLAEQKLQNESAHIKTTAVDADDDSKDTIVTM